MSAFFIKWRWITGIISIILSIAITLGACGYAGVLSCVEAVGEARTFYFVVSNSTHVEVSAQVARLQGGAGYALTLNNGEWAAYSVYFSEQESQSVCQALAQQETEAEIVTLRANRLYFKNGYQKKRANEIVGALDTMYGCMQVLEREIARLEQGATQESSKRILQTLVKQFAYLEKNNGDSVSGLTDVCESVQTQLLQGIGDVVYVKDLRYVLCELSVAYVNLSRNFSL